MSLFPSCLDLLQQPVACPGCRAHAPRWTWVAVDGLRVLTHDGDVICPADHSFGALAGLAQLPAAETAGVAE
ncbi:hypothetical protein [Streptomyces sp. NPDC003996]